MPLVEHTLFRNRELRKKEVPEDQAVVIYKGWNTSPEGKEQLEWKQILDMGKGVLRYTWYFEGRGSSKIFFGDEINRRSHIFVKPPNIFGISKKYTFEVNEQIDFSPLP